MVVHYGFTKSLYLIVQCKQYISVNVVLSSSAEINKLTFNKWYNLIEFLEEIYVIAIVAKNSLHFKESKEAY